MAPDRDVDWRNLVALLFAESGAMCPVSAGSDGTTPVAVRTRRCIAKGSTDNREHGLRQALVWFTFKHENILPLLSIITESESTTSMVVPFMEHGSAFSYVQDRDIDPRPLLLGIANGLNYLHARQFVHGAIKGTNIFISGNGCPYITVFDCSCGRYSFDGALSCSCQTTIRWLAPEHVDDQKATAKGDVWAFGMTVLELFTRLPPFSDIQEAQGVLIKILQSPPDRPSDKSTCSRMTDAWWKIYLECVEMEAASRSQMSHVADKIGRMLNGGMNTLLDND